MREPDTGFLQLLPNDWGVHRNIGRVNLHFARWMIAGRALSNAAQAETINYFNASSITFARRTPPRRICTRATFTAVAVYGPCN
jgi:hypothetical protein